MARAVLGTEEVQVESAPSLSCRFTAGCRLLPAAGRLLPAELEPPPAPAPDPLPSPELSPGELLAASPAVALARFLTLGSHFLSSGVAASPWGLATCCC